jgi:hypothetical protein
MWSSANSVELNPNGTALHLNPASLPNMTAVFYPTITDVKIYWAEFRVFELD